MVTNSKDQCNAEQLNWDELARNSPQLRALLEEAAKQARKVGAAIAALERAEQAYVEAGKQVLLYAEYLDNIRK